MTIKEAAQRFVGEMNAIDQGMISFLMEHDDDDYWNEVTAPSSGDRVYIYDEAVEGEIEDVVRDNDVNKYTVAIDSGHKITCLEEDFEVIRYDVLPMWSTMWNFGNILDEYWLDENDGIRLMSQCGFRIYHSDKYGYFFGIDGAGYDFYEAHWIPLYIARGLHWHESRTEQSA